MFHAMPSAGSTLPDMGYEDEPPFRPVKLPSGRRASDYLLFFAALPPPEVAGSAALATQRLRAKHGLSKPSMPAERLHVTLQPVCTFVETMDGGQLRRVLQIATGLAAACQQIPLRFDRVGSMGQHEPSALALKGDAATRRGLGELVEPLAQALRRHGLNEFKRGGNAPHMTLIYGTRLIADEPIEPLAWTADRLVLLLSHRGCGHYERLGTWPLRAMQPSLF